MNDPRDYKLDLSCASARDATDETRESIRPFISVHFACCGVFRRIHRSADGKSYVGHCPKCARPVHFKVGPGGTDAREFVIH